MILKLMSLSYLLLLSQLSFAEIGGVDGGGGKSVVCKDPQGEIKSVELLDLWEARTLYNLNISNAISSLGLAEGVNAVLNTLKDSYPFEGVGIHDGCKNEECIFLILQENANLFLKDSFRVKRLHGVTLQPTEDSYEIARPTLCELDQIVNYRSNGNIFINQDLYEKMDVTNQIALIAHESYYSMLRGFAKEKNSVRTRRAVGYAMSGQTFHRETPVLPKEQLECYDFAAPYAPTYISFFLKKEADTKSENLVAFPGSSHMSKFIGLEQSLFDFKMIGSKIYNMMVSGKCDRDGADNILWTINMNGPVEFDRQIQIDWVCKSGTYLPYFTDHAPGTRESVTTALTCKVRQ